MGDSSDTDTNNEDARIDLVEPISRMDLLGGKGVEFTVHMNRDEALMDRPEDIFDPEHIAQVANFDCVDLDDDSLGDTPFDSIKLKMVDLTPDGSVKKRMKKQGIGEIVPEGAVVTVHYNGYFEMNEVPFDSTSLRGRAETFPLGNHGFILGLDIAIRSMRKLERAQFLLQPGVAFGKMGCPPRVPPNAEVLFEVELVNWRVGSEAEVLKSAASSDGTAWQTVEPSVKSLLKEGVDFFKRGSYRESKVRLEEAKKIVTQCRLKDEFEEEDQKKYLFKLCINLAMIYNKLQEQQKNAPKAIINCKEVIHMKPNDPKAHLQWGYALITLGEYDRAQEHLMKAKRILPHDHEVIRAFELLEEKKKQEKELQGTMYRKMFQTRRKEEKQEEEVSEETKKNLQALESFAKNDKLNKIVLPVGLTAKERNCLTAWATKNKMKVIQSDQHFSIIKIRDEN